MQMSEEAQWARELRALPDAIQAVLASASDDAIRQRPAAGEWSAVEVAGHLIDKATNWHARVRSIQESDRPTIVLCDQDQCVRDAGYQSWDTGRISTAVRNAWESFARTVEGLPSEAIERIGLHPKLGELTIRRCIVLPLESLPNHLQQARGAIASAR